jgi:multisubunit Na+/H+ antiporter MnhF subunit
VEGVVITAAMILLLIGGACFLARALLGPSLADRVIALDGLVVTVVAVTVVLAIRDDSPRFLDLTLAVAFVGFVSATSAARFIERRGG